MIKPKNILRLKEMAAIGCGLFTALVILFSQSIYFEYVADSKTDVKTEQTSDKADVLTVSKDIVSSFAQLVIHQALHYIGELFTTGEKNEVVSVASHIHYNSLFKALFRTIISPNAP